MLSLQDVIADADFDALKRLVFDAFVTEDAEADRGGEVERGAFTMVPDYDGIGEVLEIDRLHPEDRATARTWFADQWSKAAVALMQADAMLCDPLLFGAP